MALQSDAFVLKFFEFLFKLVLNIEVSVFKPLLQIVVFVKQVIEFVHFEVEIFLGHFKLPDFFLVTSHLVVQSQFLLLENRFLISQFFTVTRQFQMIRLSLN